ncbi:MAG TPA: tRNA (adenosine(37)-N6)-threonylcarbamoyltransferase complex dimerization subunit type 1 TsaB [Pyrinomonadaceae bacterium]|nr:tRNA (adenosine(37)-N6)-threonylcarbamoyltransferase complex dimerization subunit type 1 TsaB [Pyrinomonadaceae bacterium]
MSNKRGEGTHPQASPLPPTKTSTVQTLDEKLILSIDTATDRRSVAVTRGPRVLALTSGAERNTHSANVLAEIDAALRASGLRLQQIELFAAAAGPGSFTGLRAGLATLKSFAATLQRPATGVPTLHAVAHAAGPSARVVALIPAGRGEVFAQMLEVARSDKISELNEAAHIAPAALVEQALQGARGGLVWAGSGAHAHADLIRAGAESAGVRWHEESDNEGDAATGNEGDAVTGEPPGETSTRRRDADAWTLARPAPVLAVHVAALARAAWREGRAGDAAELSAIYIRPSDAEINEQCRVHKHVTNEPSTNTSSTR